MAHTYLHTERRGDVGLLVLDNVTAHNALRPETLQEICEAVDELIAAAEVRAIVFASDGRHFCAGADFAFLEQLTTLPAGTVTDQIYGPFQGAVRRIFRSTKPTVAAIDGAAVTVGCELALACDFRVVTERATLQESWIKVGLLPALGGMYLLPRLVGLARANEMVLRGRGISGREAVQFGLATELVEPDHLRDRAVALASELAAMPARAYAQAKDGLQRGLDSTIDREWSAAINAQATLIGSAEFAAAVRRISGASGTSQRT
jgi:enoyl-CoA hydratase/carnithine racemase